MIKDSCVDGDVPGSKCWLQIGQFVVVGSGGGGGVRVWDGGGCSVSWFDISRAESCDLLWDPRTMERYFAAVSEGFEVVLVGKNEVSAVVCDAGMNSIRLRFMPALKGRWCWGAR